MMEYIAVGFTADRFKTIMSSLGVIIGVMAIVVMLSVGEGLYSGVFSEFKDFDLDLIRVVPGTIDLDHQGPPSFRSNEEPAKFTDKDLDALKRVVGVKRAAPITSSSVMVSFRNKNASTSLQGVKPSKEDDLKEKVEIGRFLTDSDYKALVIGKGVSQNMFRMKISPGTKLRLYNSDRTKWMDFKVVGVLQEEKQTSFGRVDQNNVMYTTHKAMKELLDRDNYYYQSIEVTVEDTTQTNQVVDGIREELKRLHKKEAFSATTARSMLASLENILRMIKYALGGIGAISLVVGGIGISNVMMLTVRDRIREIGVMKAIGATPRDIRLQYILEAGLLGVVSSIIGIILGGLVSTAIIALAGIPSLITVQSVLVGLMFGVLTTTLAGAYPARKASQMDPIEALRSE
jgi:putative ABC transport system permease protein